MALVGLLNNKTDHYFYYDAIEHYLEQCRDVNLLINAKKTQEMVLSFSRTYAVYDYLFINNSPIEHVANFKYLGTVFSNDLKWHANTEVLYSKIKSRFYAFSKFKDFKPTSCQKQYFIQSLIVPILFYNIELWFYSCTKGERQRLCKNFEKNGYFLDLVNQVNTRIEKTARIFISCDTHILNECYELMRSFYRMPKTRTEIFLKSLIPTIIQISNSDSMNASRASTTLL